MNELGRMFLTFGDRGSACRYFRQASLTAVPEEQNKFAPNNFAIREPGVSFRRYSNSDNVWSYIGLLFTLVGSG